MNYILASILTCIFCLAPTADGPGSQDSISSRFLLDWNAFVLETAANEDGFLTLKGIRTATMMHLAIHDALNSTTEKYERYLYRSDVPNADPVAATTLAASTILLDQYPDQEEMIQRLAKRWLEPVKNEPGYAAGRDLGKQVAKTMLQSREDDGWDSEPEYQWHPMGPGVYAEFRDHSGTPEGFIFGAGWAAARSFSMDAPGQFRSPPPPDIESDAYAEAYREVKNVGRFQSMTRTNDQTHLALWWKDFAENAQNRLARHLVVKEELDIYAAARLFALLNMGIFDAYISSFDNKYFYNHWRPYTAIRWAHKDGNSETEVEPTWTNLHNHTYAFPSYPSAHGTACAAVMTVFEDVFGDNYAFTMTTETADIAGPFSGKFMLDPPTRSFANFDSAADECALSRVYLGIHFRYDSEEGVHLGNRVGEHLTSQYLRAID